MASVKNLPKVTVYTKSAMFGGTLKIEGRLVDHGRRKYAQYNDAPYVIIVPRKKRKPRTLIEGYKPYFLILAGWDHPDVGTNWVVNSQGHECGRYTTCDDRYQTDFDREIAPYLETVEVVADYRFTNDPNAELYHGPKVRT